jgi:hypothetical protein
MFFVSGYHKTGTVFLKHLFMKIHESTPLNYIFNYHFSNILDDDIKINKCIVILRNPYEIICSGVRYHKISSEAWLHEPNRVGNKTYQEHIHTLNEDAEILFEMNYCTKHTINTMYNDVKNRNFKNQVLFIKLEDFYDNKNIPIIANKIKVHLQEEVVLEESILINCIQTCLTHDYHRTHKENNYTYPDLFDRKHYECFDNLFPTDLFEILNTESCLTQYHRILLDE